MYCLQCWVCLQYTEESSLHTRTVEYAQQRIVPKSSNRKKEFGVINSIYWHTHRSTVDKDDYQEYDPRLNTTTMPRIMWHLKFFQTMNSNVFKGEVNHKNEVDGRLYTRLKQF